MNVECPRPWFGTWPPKLKGGKVNMKQKTFWERWRVTVIMVFVLFSGVLLLLGCTLYLEKWPELKFVFDSVAVAIIIAGILGLTIDRFFRQQFAEDAFRTSIGYLLPTELRGEMEWLYKCHIICIEHIQRFDLLRIDDETCIVHVNLHRKLRNVSNTVESAKLGAAVDEWFHKTGSSRMVSAGYVKEGRSSTTDEGVIKINKTPLTVEIEETDISLAPGEEVDTWYEAEEIKRTNDVQSWNFAYPTLNPLVIVNTYEGVGFNVDFGYRIPSQQLGNDTYRLSGTLLLGQVLAVRWWKVEDANK